MVRSEALTPVAVSLTTRTEERTGNFGEKSAVRKRRKEVEASKL